MAKEILNQSFYLAISPSGWEGLKARISKSQPATAKDERVLKLTVSVPSSMFAIPTITASISIPKEIVSAPVINAQVLDNVKEIIEQQTGLDVNVRLVEGEVKEEVPI